MTKKLIYMDNNATTSIHPEVKKTLCESMDYFGNPSSLHSLGREAHHIIEKSREKIAEFINADPDELFFVGSGSEANNTVLSILPCESTNHNCTSQCSKGSGIITTKIEHPCILETSKCLALKGAKVSFLDVDSTGTIKIDQLEERLKDRSGLVSVMMANNEIGTVQDIKTIARITHESGSLFHTDAVQAIGKLPVDVKDLNVDFLTISGHKIYGPKGIGALYVRKGARFCPLIHGGHQEKGRRAGTENTLGIIGLAKAIEMRQLEMEQEEIRLLELKNLLRKEISANIPDVHFNGHEKNSLPGTLNVSFSGVEGEAILLYLDLAGICVSTGSACASGSLDPSHVLLATGLPVELAHSSIRISLGRENTKEEVQYVIIKLKETIEKLRKMSTVYS